jgi:hypothetical protein
MAYMTEEEADALDEALTRATPRVDFIKPDIFIRQRELLRVLNPIAEDFSPMPPMVWFCNGILPC